MNKKIIGIIIVGLFICAGVATGKYNNQEIVKKESNENSEIPNRLFYIHSFPLLPRVGKNVYFYITFPMFFIKGKIYWNFGDGTYLSGRNFISHQYSKIGMYYISASFELILGGSGYGTRPIYVRL
ncbi:MAG: PKD domain-containing protein [Candidatus Thermoplasmatota archaeon]|nr:PKD domain-containing protein [Candidatus Thermoplasmatota archaeon]